VLTPTSNALYDTEASSKKIDPRPSSTSPSANQRLSSWTNHMAAVLATTSAVHPPTESLRRPAASARWPITGASRATSSPDAPSA